MSNAQDRGWGGPCGGSVISINVSGTKFPGGVRAEIADLVTMLVQETKNRGYRFGTETNPSYGCWGLACRHIGNNPGKPWSNHAWALALDINAPTNPQKRPLTTDMPSWMPELWKQYGFRWGGDYTTAKPDSMHYEYMGTPADAVAHTNAARVAGLGGGTVVTPPPTSGGTPPASYPPFPFPAGHWMGVKSSNPKNHSGYWEADRPGIQQYQQRLRYRGWSIGVDGLFGNQTRDVTVRYQQDKGLTADGLAGEQTWKSVWTAPIT